MRPAMTRTRSPIQPQRQRLFDAVVWTAALGFLAALGRGGKARLRHLRRVLPGVEQGLRRLRLRQPGRAGQRTRQQGYRYGKEGSHRRTALGVGVTRRTVPDRL